MENSFQILSVHVYKTRKMYLLLLSLKYIWILDVVLMASH